MAARLKERLEKGKAGRPKEETSSAGANGQKESVPNLGRISERPGHRAAKLLNVSHGSVEAAVAVQKHGDPELQAAVDKGDVSVSDAASVVDLPAERRG